MRLRLFTALSILLASAVSAQFVTISGGTPPELRTEWRVEPAASLPGIRELGSKELVLKQRLLPSGLVELGRAVTKAEAGVDLPAGTQLIEVKSSAGTVFCEGEMHTGGLAGRKQTCLLDSDRDNRFDTAFTYMPQAPALVVIEGRLPKKRLQLAAPIPYDRIDPARSRFDAFVAIERRNFFNIYGRENFQIVYGSGAHQERITVPIGFKSPEMPKELTILGARFTALSERDGKMTIRVDQGMPDQPFAVMRIVTYR
jgi:hypothetical protein